MTSYRSVRSSFRPRPNRHGSKRLLTRTNAMAFLSLLMVAVTIFVEPPSFPDVFVFDAPQNSLSKFRGLSPKRLLRGEYVLKNEEPHIDFRLQNQAVALFSFGEDAAESTLLERCVLSIRRRGDFHGPVVVITDAPSARYLNVFDENVIVLKNREEDMKDYFDSDGESDAVLPKKSFLSMEITNT